MKNKKRIKFGILIATIIAIAIIGTIGVKKMNKPTEKERQIAFLKKHEEEMTEYIKWRNPKSNINIIKYDWKSFRIEDSGAFTRNMYIVDIELYDLANNEIDGGTIQILPNNIQRPTEMEEIATNNFDEALEGLENE
ncbi:hypothetical protein E5K21_000072 [Enterococcus faecalis]|nr:hypothetical protein [Enterococcus faecalis]